MTKTIIIYLQITFSIFAQYWETAPEVWSEPVLIDTSVLNQKWTWYDTPSVTSSLDTIYYTGGNGVYRAVRRSVFYEDGSVLYKDGSIFTKPDLSWRSLFFRRSQIFFCMPQRNSAFRAKTGCNKQQLFIFRYSEFKMNLLMFFSRFTKHSKTIQKF